VKLITEGNYLALSLKFVLYEAGPSPYSLIDSMEVLVPSEDPVPVIVQAAKARAKRFLAWDGTSADKVDVYEVRGRRYPSPTHLTISQPLSSYKQAYNKSLKQMESLSLYDCRLARFGRLLTPGVPLKAITSPILIIQCGPFTFAIHTTSQLSPLQPCASTLATSCSSALGPGLINFPGTTI
jgi:hypothetical protein